MKPGITTFSMNYDKIIAMNASDRLDFEMDMRRLENDVPGAPIKARVKVAAWCLVEGTDADGKKFNYIVGFPKKSEASVIDKGGLLSNVKGGAKR